MNINKIISDIKERGVVRPHSFEVDIPIPEYLRGTYGDSRSIITRCESSQIPGITLASVDGPPRYGYGPVERIPYVSVYNESYLSFILDRESDIYRFFYNWINCIVNIENDQGNLDHKNSNGFSVYEVGYKTKYSVDLKVTLLNDTAGPIQRSTMYRAFPQVINQVELNWGDTDSIVKLQVGFSYRDYKVEFI